MKISIEGNIGSGKSTLIARLCSEKRMPVFLEPVDEWKEWLSIFYKDPSRWSMSFNLNVLLSFNKWMNNDFVAVYERSPITNRSVFTQLGFEQGFMNKLELDLFDAMYSKLAWEPNIVIYIRTSPETSMERMTRRGRNCESSVPLEYLQSIHEKHEELFHGKHKITGTFTRDITVIEVDGNEPHDVVYQSVLEALASVGCL